MGTLGPVSLLILIAAVTGVLSSAQDCTCSDNTQNEGLENRVSELEAAVSQLQSTVVKLRQEANKMKKLTVASLNVALTPEEDRCQQTDELVKIIGGLSFYVGLGPNSCELMGTALYPAISCSQLHEACHKPSATYFIQGTVFSEVFCEMDEFGGGWTRFGKGGMESMWNYTDEDEEQVNLTIISPREVKLIQDLNFNTFRVFTDVVFRLQADDSTNPSTLVMRSLPWLERETISIGHGRDHTHLLLNDDEDRLICFGSSSSTQCGRDGLPRRGEVSKRLAFTFVFFGPRAVHRGAQAHESQWSRNRYSWSGSFYYLLAK